MGLLRGLMLMFFPFFLSRNNNNNKELLERFWKLKALYNLK